MKRLSIFFCLLAFGLLAITAQENEIEKKPSLDHGTIQSQFDYLLKVSTTYQEYKVIKIESFHKFKNNISDSLNVAYRSITDANKEIAAQKSAINSLQTELDKLKKDLDLVNREKNSISLLGIAMSKSAYKTLMWAIVFILLILAVGAFLLFQRSNKVTKSTKTELLALQDEFEQHRKRALKREQELAVKYHNEINKLKQNLT